jgi:1,4-dihydroxy-2-naphthoate octaprenyltransferase
VNYLNEYFDWKYGLDTAQSLGSTTVIFRGEMTGAQVLGMGLACFGVAAALGLWLIALIGPAILLFGLAALFIGYFYSARPFKFAARGLGDLMVYVPMGLLVVAILNANNIRDYHDDRAVNKRTLPVRFGRGFALRYQAGLVYGAYAATTLLVALGLVAPHAAGLAQLSLPWLALLVWLTFPLAHREVRSIFAAGERDPTLRMAVRRAAALHFQFGVALAAILPRG